MYFRILFVVLVAAAGLAAGSLSPDIARTIRAGVAVLPFPGLAHVSVQELASAKPAADGHGHSSTGHAEGEKEVAEGAIRMPNDRITAAKIEVAPAAAGVLAKRVTVPGTIVPDPNRIARVAAKVVGTVAALNKRLGDTVQKGELVATLDSREVAEAKSEYVSRQVNADLQKTLFEREQALFAKKITAEQQFLKARQTFTEAQLRSELARQKLFALNVDEQEVATLSRQTLDLQSYSIKSPMAGRVVERLVDLGAPVGGEGQAKELYVLADLSAVWVELSVSTSDLGMIQEGQRVAISGGPGGKTSEARIVFISPMLNQETRSARVIAEIDNNDMAWRPGSYVTAQILADERTVDLRVPRSALQTIAGETVLFVRTTDGFEKREVALGAGDDQSVEIVFGLDPGEKIATSNSFVLKAELGKAEAEHAH